MSEGIKVSSSSIMSGNLIGEIETRSSTPVTFRLAKYPCGKMVLQGGFSVQKGFRSFHIDWEELPTIEVDEDGKEKPQNQPDE